MQALLDLQLNYASNQVRTAGSVTHGTVQNDESSYLDISKDNSRVDIKLQDQSLKQSEGPAQGSQMTMLLNKKGEKVVRMCLEDGRTIFVNLKKLTQHKA